MREAKKAGYAYVALDGTLIPIDRVAADRPFYSGKHRRHGMNLQVIVSPTGDIVWVSGRCPEPSTTQRPHGSRASCASWRPPAWSPSPTRATRAPRTPERRTRGRTSPNPKNKPTEPTPSSAHPANVRTPSSRPGASSASSAAAPGAPDSSPRPSTYCRSAKQTQDEKGSVVQLRLNVVEPPGGGPLCPDLWSGSLRGLCPPEVGRRGALARPVAGPAKQGGRVPACRHGLGGLPGFQQGHAEIVQRHAVCH